MSGWKDIQHRITKHYEWQFGSLVLWYWHEMCIAYVHAYERERHSELIAVQAITFSLVRPRPFCHSFAVDILYPFDSWLIFNIPNVCLELNTLCMRMRISLCVFSHLHIHLVQHKCPYFPSAGGEKRRMDFFSVWWHIHSSPSSAQQTQIYPKKFFSTDFYDEKTQNFISPISIKLCMELQLGTLITTPNSKTKMATLAHLNDAMTIYMLWKWSKTAKNAQKSRFCAHGHLV